MKSGTVPRASITIIGLLFLLLIALRFIHLGADFPLGITWSGELYTDEGWYADAATRDAVSGQWYLPGDFNPAVNLPLGQLLQRLAFWLFGLSLVSARIFGTVASSLVIVAAGLLVRRGAGIPAGVLTALLLASSYIGFAYSRMAVMEPLGLLFVTAALLVAQRPNDQHTQRTHALAKFLLSGLLVAAATLVKGNMIFAIPVVAYMAWRDDGSLRQRLLLAATGLLTSMVVIIGWQILARHYFHADYTYFDAINLGARRVTGLGDWLSNLRRQFSNMKALGRGFLDVATLLVVAAAVLAPLFRRRPIVHVLLFYSLAYFALLTVVNYGPPRYFLPLLVPVGGLAAIACADLAEWLRQSRLSPLATAPFLLAALVVLGGSARIVATMARPHYSFLQMTSGVRAIIGHRDARMSDVFLLGHMADSVALETGVRAVNTRMGPVPLVERLTRYRPSYVLIHTDAAETLGAIRSQGGSVSKLGAWDVYGNYYGAGQDIELFAIDWSRAAQPIPR